MSIHICLVSVVIPCSMHFGMGQHKGSCPNLPETTGRHLLWLERRLTAVALAFAIAGVVVLERERVGAGDGDGGGGSGG